MITLEIFLNIINQIKTSDLINILKSTEYTQKNLCGDLISILMSIKYQKNDETTRKEINEIFDKIKSGLNKATFK